MAYSLNDFIKTFLPGYGKIFLTEQDGHSRKQCLICQGSGSLVANTSAATKIALTCPYCQGKKTIVVPKFKPQIYCVADLDWKASPQRLTITLQCHHPGNFITSCATAKLNFRLTNIDNREVQIVDIEDQIPYFMTIQEAQKACKDMMAFYESKLSLEQHIL